jgi:hypothetical protein
VVTGSKYALVERERRFLVPARRSGQSARVPEQVSGLVQLGDGWSVALPNECMCERNADGSWSAWDAVRQASQGAKERIEERVNLDQARTAQRTLTN